MKKLFALLLALAMLLSAIPFTSAEEPDLLTDVLDSIESFDPETDEVLSIRVEDISKFSEKTDISAPYLGSLSITYNQLGTNEANTYLPSAALLLDTCTYNGWTYSSMNIKAYAGVNDYYEQWVLIGLDYTHDQVLQLWWTPGKSVCEFYRYYDDDDNLMTVSDFLNSEESSYLSQLTLLNNSTLTRYVNQLTGVSTNPLKVGKATFEISSDKQSIYINKPSISGGSGKYTIAYNIYDNNSNAVNYFYSTESRVAATPGYGGLFNVFIVVTDTGTNESNTQNIGWQKLNWPYASTLTVGKVTYEISSDKKSVFINRPTVKCKSGEVTIAYNIYDSNSKPVNYFYSTFPRVAATPGYAGKFNVYVVVTDTGTGESKTQNIGWVNLLGDGNPPTTGATYRALLIAQTQVPNCTPSYSYHTDNVNLTAALKKVNGGGYASHITALEQRTRSQILSDVASAYSGAKAGDVSFFYMGTHGVDGNYGGSDVEGALGCSDGSNLKLKDLADALSKANPNNEVIIVISACGSGAAVKGLENETKLPLTARDIISAFAANDPGITVTEEEYDENGVVVKRRDMCRNKFYVLTAADVYESSWYYSNYRDSNGNINGRGSFTGLGMADALTFSGGYMKADSNKNGQVTFDELYKYVYDYCYNLSVNAGTDTKQHVQRYPTSSSWVAFAN
ncbi:MAG: caspase family protein [Clostridia bacterium]|nr:caspase family protein [Clostridia bacterium]